MSVPTRFGAAAAVLSVAAYAACLVSPPALAQSPVVQPQYFGAPVSPVVAVDLNGASSQPLGQSAFPGGHVSSGPAGVASYGQRVLSESSPQLYTGVAGSGGSGAGRSVRP